MLNVYTEFIYMKKKGDNSHKQHAHSLDFNHCVFMTETMSMNI